MNVTSVDGAYSLSASTRYPVWLPPKNFQRHEPPDPRHHCHRKCDSSNHTSYGLPLLALSMRVQTMVSAVSHRHPCSCWPQQTRTQIRQPRTLATSMPSPFPPRCDVPHPADSRHSVCKHHTYRYHPRKNKPLLYPSHYPHITCAICLRQSFHDLHCISRSPKPVTAIVF